MPTYPMICACGHKLDVVKPMAQHDSPEPCPQCSLPMSKDYGDPGWARAGVVTFRGHFNPSLGRYVGSKQDIVDAQNRIQDMTGSRPIEIGDEKPKYNPQREDVDMRAVLADAERLQTERGEAVNG